MEPVAPQPPAEAAENVSPAPSLVPLRPAVQPNRDRRNVLLGALVGATAASVAIGVTAVAILATRDAPAAAVTRPAAVHVELHRYVPTPINSCGPHMQFAVYRFDQPQYEQVVEVLGLPRMKLSCIYGPGGELAIGRTAGADDVFGTSDDECWQSRTPCMMDLRHQHRFDEPRYPRFHGKGRHVDP